MKLITYNLTGFETAKNRFRLWKLNSGFTLVEMIVAIAVFAQVMLVATGSLLSIIAANQKAQALQTVMNNLNFALDTMARDMRTGYHYAYPAVSSLPSTCSTKLGESISFTNQDGDALVYCLNTSSQTIDRQFKTGPWLPVTAVLDLKIKRLFFDIQGLALGDGLQPRVLILVGGEANNGTKSITTFNLETLVSERVRED